MALLVVEGFEGFGATTGAAPQPAGALARQYTVANEAGMDIETGRLSGYSCEFGSTTCSMKTETLTTDDTLIVGFAVKVSVLDNPTFLKFYDGVTVGIQLIGTPTGQLSIYLGGGLLGTSGVVMAVGNWYYVEVKVKCNNATGTYEVRVGGANILSDSGVDTRLGAHDYHDSMFFGMSFGLGTVAYDDIYICDSTGAQNNTFLGNSRIVAIAPDGDDSAGWNTASGASDHYLDVDENPADDDTSYVEDNTTGHKDLYDYAAMPGSLGNIRGLVVKTTCRETDASNFDIIMPIKSNITETDDAPQAIGTTSYVTKIRISELDPDTSAAWLEAGVNAAKFGVKTG